MKRSQQYKRRLKVWQSYQSYENKQLPKEEVYKRIAKSTGLSVSHIKRTVGKFKEATNANPSSS